MTKAKRKPAKLKAAKRKANPPRKRTAKRNPGKFIGYEPSGRRAFTGAKTEKEAMEKAQKHADKFGYNVTVKSVTIGGYSGNYEKTIGKVTPHKRNPTETAGDTAAAAMYERFHGRKSTKVTEYITEEEDTVHLSELGRLVELTVLIDDDWETPLAAQGNIQVCTTPDGSQISFHGGNQQLDLKALGADDQRTKAHVVIGECSSITYHTKKEFHNFEPIDYIHTFGETDDDDEELTGRLPLLQYSTHYKRMFLSGGSYKVKPEGIVG